jgi:hypothetical protein
MKPFIYLVLAFLLSSLSTLNSQEFEYYNCPEVQVNRNAQEAQFGGLYKPSITERGQYFRVLFVFAQFSDDNRTFPDWTYGQLPTYAYNIVDSVVADNYRSFTLSDYWKKMARGSYDLIGDVYPQVITLRSEDWYRTNNKSFQDANIDVLDSINGKVDFKKFENWGYNSTTKSFYFNPRNADKTLDMMYIIYRSPDTWFGTWGGIAILGSNFSFTTHDSTIIDGNWLGNKASGVTIRTGAGVHFPSYIGLLAHELGHYFFGPIHTAMGGIMCNNPSGTFALNGWERERIGHTAYTTAYQDTFTITLGDFVETGQVLQVPIPGSNDKYFLVENHQRLSKYDQIMRGGQLQGAFDTTTTLGKGIYIWLIKNANSVLPTIDVRTANGSWNWTYVGDYYAGPGWYVGLPYEGYLPKTKRSAVNRHSGKSDRHPNHLWWNGHWASKWVDSNQVTRQYEITRNVMGLESHAFNFDVNKQITPWSSPSTYVDGVTNISIQIINENGNNVTLRVYKTEQASLNLPPSRPQHLNIGPNPGNNLVRLSWTHNIEPDLSLYEVWRKIDFAEDWVAIGTTSNDYFVDPEMYYLPLYGLVTTRYKIRAKDTQNLYSDYSEEIVSKNEPMWKEQIDDVPSEVLDYKLSNNYPNPFNPTTLIQYSVKAAGWVTVIVYDILGSEVDVLVNSNKEPGIL